MQALPRLWRREADTTSYVADYLTRSVRRASGFVLADHPLRNDIAVSTSTRLSILPSLSTLSTRGCAPARQCIRVPTPRRHVAAPRSVHTSTGTSDALNDHHDTIPVRHCSPSYRFGDQLPFKSHSAPRPPQTPAASS